MQNLLAFMSALKDNSNFVGLVFVICVALCICFITASIKRTVRKKQQQDFELAVESKRIDASRSIVPVKRMED